MKLSTAFRNGVVVSLAPVALLACSSDDAASSWGTGGSAPVVTGGSGGGAGTSAKGGQPSVTTGGVGTGGVVATGGTSVSATGGKASSGGSGAGGSGGTPSSAGTAGSNAGRGGGGANSTGGGGNKAGSSGAPSGGSASGGAGGGSGGGAAAEKSAGCGTMTNQMTARWVESMIMSGNSNRPYSVYLPTGYDPMRAYPVIVLLHGCGGGTNNVMMEGQTKSDAILIRGTGSASQTCWEASATGPDVVFFDAMVADVKARFCTDTKRFFAVGYSSGSWLANQLGCIRANVLRGLGTVAGGNPGVRQCVGPIAHMFVHDENDPSNGISGSVSARDRLLMQNNCDADVAPVAEAPSPCVRYQGCDPGYPVKWCQTQGQNHNRQDNLAAPGFWNFFKEF